MKLPKEINPNPLITSTVELRFDSGLSEEDVLGRFYSVFSKNFPKITEYDNVVPRKVRQTHPDFAFHPYYVLRNDKYSLSIGKNIIAFENIGKYQLWDNYFPVIKENLELLKNADIVSGLSRVGTRYVSFFEGTDSIERALNFDYTINYNDYKQENQLIRTQFYKDNIKQFVQIFNNASIEKTGVPTQNGLYIDIDAYVTDDLPDNINNSLYALIDTLHSEQKSLLFKGLMKEAFIETLDITY